MIITTQIAIRIAVILVAAVLLQLSFFSQLPLLGTTINVVPVVVVCLGLLGGAVVGAVCGFAAGLLIDSVLVETLGVSSLALLGIGYLAGRFREGYEIPNPFVPALVAGALTLAAGFAFAALQVTLGVDAHISLLVLREIVVQALLGGLVALGIYPLIRRILRPALVDDAPTRAPSRRSPIGTAS